MTQKVAEIESISIIRELKVKTPYPISEHRINDYLSIYYISDTDKKVILDSIEHTQETLDIINELLSKGDKDYEPINMQRAIKMLNEIKPNLQKNLEYAEQFNEWQDKYLIPRISGIFNTIPKLQDDEKRKEINEKLNTLFKKILRNEEFKFNSKDIINELHMNHMGTLSEGIKKGFFFHVTLVEEISRMNFDHIRKHIPKEKLQKTEQIAKLFAKIEKGVNQAYQMNMRMINLALVLYSYVKWLNADKSLK